MVDNGIEHTEKGSGAQDKTVTGVIKKIAESVVDGNSHYYLLLEDSDMIYDVNLAEHLSVIRYNPGDTITLKYREGKTSCPVIEVGE